MEEEREGRGEVKKVEEREVIKGGRKGEERL